MALMRLLLLMAMFSGQWSVANGQQITIGGNVYGGGKSGNLSGSTKVTVYGGDFKDVYGGAQQANVGGSTFLHLDGEHASDDIFIVNAYGGNDISGTIGQDESVTTTVPTELENIWESSDDDDDKTKNKIDNTWKSFVRTSACKEKKEVTVSEDQTLSIDANMLVVASLFGGSNGDYDYDHETISTETTNTTTDPETGESTTTTTTTTEANPYYGMVRPDITKTYLEIKGGCLAHVYGGGNNATVTEATTIHIENSSDHLEKGGIVFAAKKGFATKEQLTTYFQSKVHLATFQSKLDSWAFNHARVFGGNNKATMDIMPKWNVQRGIIRDLFSGGNEGAMIYKNGLLLEIDPSDENKDHLEIVNVYGGCRRADVHPMEKITTGANIGEYEDVQAYSPEGYKFPAGLSARTLVRGGKIHNVYGGNDISGKVYGGNAVGIYTSILGDIYGGGNGSYAYTDNATLAKNDEYKDFYYNPGGNSVAALNAFRPNAEEVSIRLAGTDADHPTIIHGRVFVGGNSATLKEATGVTDPRIELKIGSHVIADNVFLGNNGENMIDNSADGVLAMYAGTTSKVPTGYSSLDLTGATTFAEYMEGCAMGVIPSVVFDKQPTDRENYIPLSSFIGSLYCGGNVGSMTKAGAIPINFTEEVVIYNKLVGGCNTAFVEASDGLNARYEGGLINDPDANGNKLLMNLSGLKLRPMRWKVQRDVDYNKILDANGNEQYELDDNGNQQLEWNTIYASTGKETAPLTDEPFTQNTTDPVTTTEYDLDRRFTGGSIYGGCYTSGRVEGNVVINVNSTLVERDLLFDKVNTDDLGEEESLYGDDQATQETFTYDTSVPRRSGVILAQQGMDVLGKALNIFGGGKGKSTEIWGSTTINLNAGYIFQVFGGSEEGIIGKPVLDDNGLAVAATTDEGTYADGIYSFNSRRYEYSPAYSCYVNLCGDYAGVSKKASQEESMAECEFMYGGGFLGPIAGNTVINLGKGRIFNSFAGSCNADILGHAETYIGRQVKEDNKSLMGSLGAVENEGVSQLDSDDIYEEGFPWVRDITYGGNDLGGTIYGRKCFAPRVRSEVIGLVHNPVPPGASTAPAVPKALTASAYTEYLQGRADAIFGGCYGTYNYSEARFAGVVKPFMEDAFVNFRPTYAKTDNEVNRVFGAGEGIDQSVDADRDGDLLQNGSYVLVDVPSEMENFESTEFFGGGMFNGLGMKFNYSGITDEAQRYEALPANFDIDHASALIDLARGKVGNVYGGSYNEGIVRRSMINVPESSTINVDNIFGGGFGADINIPCDVIETQVNYHSATATVRNNLYGGNNNADRTLYSQINITKPVWQNEDKGYLATVYGAGRGVGTWSEYTEVNLLPGAKVFEVYGGGENGRVINAQTLGKWQAADPSLDLTLHGYVNVGLADPLAKETALGGKYNTNVHIHKDATVANYAYGGGLGDKDIANSGDVYGTTYIDLLGGTVNKDIYAAGTTGSVMDYYKVGSGTDGFTAGTTAYVAGGTCRNVYGGGWKGSVGKHTKMVEKKDENDQTVYENGQPVMVEVAADIHDPAGNDIMGESHVVIGVRKDQTDANLLASIRKVLGESATLADYGFYCGQPTIQRNAYGGGEGGAVYGKANLTLNNGYIGYDYDAATMTYREKVDDETYYDAETGTDGTGRLRDCGNVFGGGYDARSSVDESNVGMWGGMVRGSLHGGGEIATIGRGATQESNVANSERTFKEIYRAGKTFVDVYNGHVMRNVYGGGKGYNLLGYGSDSELYTDGYVFGSTELHIHGGEIGTDEGLKEYGYGNVFGGGDLGYVYSKGFNSTKTVEGKADGTTTGSPDHYYYYDTDGHLTEDCKVVVSPYMQLKEDQTVSYGGKTYGSYDYVPTDYLNTLPAKSDDGTWTGDWQKLITEDADGERGVLIHNAVFGGGNVATNSDTHYANAVTVFGNATATLYDVYHRDFITVGTEHTGGIYGGGNLSMVNGYRELNITNYGTDYYGLQERISLEEYHNLSNRERAYFKLEYLCVTEYTDQNGKKHPAGEKISEEDYNKMDDAYKGYWEQYGFCSIYAGRLLNTIQRADLCGVYGSRLVLQGARDRVADVGENIDYTINRVGELSLNKSMSGDAYHGNYFGIYNLVNYLGNLTSDVRFVSNYVDENGTEHTDKSYYSYKEPQPNGNWRNRGKSHNQLALASGVYLELTTENSTADHKDYGLITGVVELDLINVKKDIVGGGFVYAKNEHRLPIYYADMENVVLSEYNKDKTGVRAAAKTYKRYRYSADAPGNWPSSEGFVVSGGTAYEEKEIQTSGNFIHAKKRIVDDCYPTNNRYAMSDPDRSPAHYWYVKGSVYIYDQVVSAYTGSSSAYSKEVHLPLTITAASSGRLKLLNVKPNRYAYYYENGKKIGTGANADEGKVWVNHQADSYELNDVITWWDWQNLPDYEQSLFVEETCVNAVACIIDGQPYAVGEYVMLPDERLALASGHTITDAAGNAITNKNGTELTGTDLVDEVFRSSNNVGGDTGYVLTLDMDTPSIWDDYHTKTEGTGKVSTPDYKLLTDAQKNDYTEGPTFTPTSNVHLGMRDYTEGQVITKAEYDLIPSENNDAQKSWIDEAYVAKEDVTYTFSGTTKTVNAGTAISATEYSNLSASAQAAFDVAYVCTGTVKLGEESYMLVGELRTKTEYDVLPEGEVKDALTPAYICKKTGTYGGRLYAKNTNYSAIQSWCALSETERANFTFNYDALNLFADTHYSVETPGGLTTWEAYDGLETEDESKKIYSKEVGVEYYAVFKAKDNVTSYTYNGITLTNGEMMSNTDFETYVRNDKRYYTSVSKNTDLYTRTGDEKKVFYVATSNFLYDGEPYGKGQVVSRDVYDHKTSEVEEVVVDENVADDTFYYCYQAHDEGGTTVEKGTQITSDAYKNLTDDQQYFVIQGQEPTETTTLYVNRESDIKDVTKEKVITVVYQYTYYETDDNGDIKLTNELHVINVHLQLESGVPTIGPLENPPTVLPGNSIGMKAPTVSPGLYEVLTNGWELFSNKDDADNHRNGTPFTNNVTPVYWYQNKDHYLAFYSLTYLGKTYSNYVPISVANYHDLADLMERHKDNHLYIDRSDVDRPCKVYINDYSALPDDDARKGKNGLDELKSLFGLTVLDGSAVGPLDANGLMTTGDFEGHAPLQGDHIKGCDNLEIFLRADLTAPATVPSGFAAWTPLGDATQCFSGNIHGDGHTVRGLDHSLFGNLCGSVYNLGVTGSFTSAGVADTGDGFVENCWVKSSATSLPDGASQVEAVFGNPTALGECTQIVNCYYPKSNEALYTDHTSSPRTGGNARKMPAKAFYDGTVAYNLNGFYLSKRYYDGSGLAAGEDNTGYDFITANSDGTLPMNASATQNVATTAYYPSGYTYYTPENTTLTPKLGYVEHRFYDGDFRYAGGTIPDTYNVRRQENEVTINSQNTTVVSWVPIWPDDYLFFGQALTYGYVDGRTHQETPSAITKSDDRLLLTDASNRVYRAPAYFRSSKMEVAHFNPYAVFAKENAAGTMELHKGMTAIDFTGANGDITPAASDYHQGTFTVSGGSAAGTQQFFPPLLDDGGLTGFRSVGLTKNLLAYTFTGTEAARKTDEAVMNAITDFDYAEGTASGNGYVAGKETYRTVAEWDRVFNYNRMTGHWVQGNNDRSAYTAQTDHLLVDKEDFNAPIAYTFSDGHRMWHQRKPDNYVETVWVDDDDNESTPNVRTTTGWEHISLPFKVDVVTTQQKGEITHFYSTSKGNYGSKGHEYWLREYKGGSTDGDLFKATLNRPAADSNEEDKDYTNTFLWDYYYSRNGYDDANGDDYQENDEHITYYKAGRTYEDYPRMAGGMPYLIGFPSEQYYEFDLSGTFVPKNTAATTPAKLAKQVITFASPTGASIAVSDTEKGVYEDGYTFKPNYLNGEIDAGYVMKADGSQYDKVGAATAVTAFRPYFVDGNATSRKNTRSIVFAGADEGDGQHQTLGPQGIKATAGRHKITVSSTMREPVTIRIIAPSGLCVATFDLQTGESRETHIVNVGVYIVQSTDGRYTRKLIVQ